MKPGLLKLNPVKMPRVPGRFSVLKLSDADFRVRGDDAA